ncbi:unnamed protein product [Psylliodes chrysocephalus]|uniref:Uncharacterized protein n=1 Tax=Psylliodes chrysocephalus TaxID=3402493 RepID=A0A9P0CV89_9CUCU|nr:unnamed protein product [Psylliodes chrysocephala]
MEWALCYRKNLFVRGNNTNNICESAMMVMKEYILQRVKAFNMVHLADFVISRFDLYFEQKILNCTFNRLSNQLLFKQSNLQRNVDYAVNIVEIASNIFSVPSEKDKNKSYIVNGSFSKKEGKLLLTTSFKYFAKLSNQFLAKGFILIALFVPIIHFEKKKPHLKYIYKISKKKHYHVMSYYNFTRRTEFFP